MRVSSSLTTSAAILALSAVAAACQNHTEPAVCHFKPSANATAENVPSNTGATAYPYDITSLLGVPVSSTVCTTDNTTEALACARKYIDAIDEQLGFLYARRLGYAAVAGAAKFTAGTDLNDPSRNDAVAAGMAARVVKYGGNEETGLIMGGEGCQIYASLVYEGEQIKEDCDPKFDQTFERVCA